jgi:hypothetical protein
MRLIAICTGMAARDGRSNTSREPSKIGFGIENRQQLRSGLGTAVGASPH